MGCGWKETEESSQREERMLGWEEGSGFGVEKWERKRLVMLIRTGSRMFNKEDVGCSCVVCRVCSSFSWVS